MELPVGRLSLFACLCAASLLLSGCGKDANGFGDVDLGTSGYTKGFGNVEGYGNKEVGLCSYTGGCMPDSDEDGGQKASSSKRSTDSGAHADSPDDSGSH